MSVLVSDLIDRTARALGDPQNKRLGNRDDLLLYFNEVQLELGTTLQCLEADDYFDTIAGQPRYAYPDDNVQVTKIRWAKTATPTDLGDYYYLDEKFEEEFRRDTNWYRAQGFVFAYRARSDWFEVIGTPTVSIPNGGIFTSWHHPAWLLTEASQTMELMDFLQGHVRLGMEIMARLGGRELAFGTSQYKAWQAKTDEIRSQIEDRSGDRRVGIRPPMDFRTTHGQR